MEICMLIFHVIFNINDYLNCIQSTKVIKHVYTFFSRIVFLSMINISNLIFFVNV